MEELIERLDRATGPDRNRRAAEMTATLTSTDLDKDRCPRCGSPLGATDDLDRLRAENARLRAALELIAGSASDKLQAMQARGALRE